TESVSKAFGTLQGTPRGTGRPTGSPDHLRRLRLLDLLRRIHGKELKIAEAVAAVIAVTFVVKIELRALRQPELHAPLLKLHGPILNRQVFAAQPDRGDFLGEVGLQPQYLIRVRSNPGAGLQLHRIPEAHYVVAVHAARPIVALPEMNLPGRLAAPLPEPFATHLEVRDVVGMEDQGEGRQAHRRQPRGKRLE